MYQKRARAHFSHSSSSTYISSYSSYEPCPPHQIWRRKTGFAWKSGLSGAEAQGGKRKTSLKSIEFSEGGFHFTLRDRSASGAGSRPARQNLHVWISARCVWRANTSVNEAIVSMLQGRNVNREDLFDMIREVYLLNLYADIS